MTGKADLVKQTAPATERQSSSLKNHIRARTSHEPRNNQPSVSQSLRVLGPVPCHQRQARIPKVSTNAAINDISMMVCNRVMIENGGPRNHDTQVAGAVRHQMGLFSQRHRVISSQPRNASIRTKTRSKPTILQAS